MIPAPRLSSYLVDDATSEELSEQWDGIEGRIERRTRQRKRAAVASALTLALASAAAAVVLVLARRTSTSERAWTSRSEPMLVALTDGSQVQLRPDSDVRLLRERAGEVRWRVARGGARFEVRRDPQRRFQVTAATVDVVVTGTAFSVELDGRQGAARVAVERGEVEIHPLGETRLLAVLHAGESWPTDPAPELARPAPLGQAQSMSRTPSVAPAVEPSTAPARGARPNSPPGLTSADRRSAPADPRHLWEEANAARRTGDVARAAALLDALRVNHPRDPRAGLACFELGRLRMDALGDLAGAVQALKQSIALAPGGVFREDAEACLATAYARMPDRTRCEQARRSYLDRYPQGTHAAEISALTCR